MTKISEPMINTDELEELKIGLEKLIFNINDKFQQSEDESNAGQFAKMHLETILINANNSELSDADFRQFVKVYLRNE